MNRSEIEREARKMWRLIGGDQWETGRRRSRSDRRGMVGSINATWWTSVNWLFLECPDEPENNAVPITSTYERFLERFTEVVEAIQAVRTLRAVRSLK